MADRIPIDPLAECATRWGVDKRAAAQALFGELVTEPGFRVMGFSLPDLVALQYVCTVLSITPGELARRYGKT
jgi:hypothetical protein